MLSYPSTMRLPALVRVKGKEQSITKEFIQVLIKRRDWSSPVDGPFYIPKTKWDESRKDTHFRVFELRSEWKEDRKRVNLLRHFKDVPFTNVIAIHIPSLTEEALNLLNNEVEDDPEVQAIKQRRDLVHKEIDALRDKASAIFMEQVALMQQKILQRLGVQHEKGS